LPNEFPRVYLAIDNCFASKRWTAPRDWAELIASLGLYYVEASADNESDPLYTTPAYLSDWVNDVRRAEQATGVQVANLYSGHGTYATLGLAHTDVRIRDRFQHEWLGRMVDVAAQLDAGLGFFCHAFPEPVLQDPVRYAAAKADLYRRLGELAAYAAQTDCGPVGVEQMYTPHQVPWRIDGAERLLCEAYAASGAPLYLTIDVGHQSGQHKFLRPSETTLRSAIAAAHDGERTTGLWLGPQAAYDLVYDSSDSMSDEQCVARLQLLMDGYPHMFAEHVDGDPYTWLSRLGAYSPIIHLQQTSGHESAHRPFTEAWNREGVIEPSKVLSSLAVCYGAPVDPSLPPRCQRIYLTLEIFTGTADIPYDRIESIKQSVRYWREWVPEDGLPLDRLPGVQVP